MSRAQQLYKNFASAQARHCAIEHLFLSSIFAFQFGFSYRLTRRYYNAFSNAEPLAANFLTTSYSMLKRLHISFNSFKKFNLQLRNTSCKLFMFAFILISGCSDVNLIYVDTKQQAIVSCDGTGLKRLSIENDSEEIILEGTEAVIKFNQINNVMRTSVNGKNVDNYKLTLRNNCDYKIRKDNGSDRGPIVVTFKTNDTGKIIETSDSTCK